MRGMNTYLMMSMCPFLAARWSGDVPFGSAVSPFLGSSKAAHMLLDSNNWTTCAHTRTSATLTRQLTDLYFSNTRKLSPQLCQIHTPGPEEFSQHCLRCTGWTGAAAASQTGVKKQEANVKKHQKNTTQKNFFLIAIIFATIASILVFCIWLPLGTLLLL